MVISLSSFLRPRSQEMRPKSGEHSKTLQDSSRIHSAILSGSSQPLPVKTELELPTCSCSGIYTNHLSYTWSLSKRRRAWWISGDGTMVTTISTMMVLTVIEDSQLIDIKTMSDTPTSIKSRGTRECPWSISIGGAEIKTSESTSTWERETTSSQPCLGSTMSHSMRRPCKRTSNGPTSELLNSPDDHCECTLAT